MQITHANYSMSAAHRLTVTQREQVEIEVFGPDRPANPAASSEVRVDTPARPPGAVLRPDHPHAPSSIDKSAGDGAEEDDLPAQLALLKTIVERLTGRLMEIFDADALQADPELADTPRTPPPVDGRPTGARIRHEYEYAEQEDLAFRARGEIRTADGQTIAFQLQLRMERSFVERSSSEIIWGEVPELKDPLVINFDGRAAGLTDQRYAFDIDADGEDERIPGLTSGRAFLVLDSNANGRVDDGSELLGAISGDAFADLAALDNDGNGFVDGGDIAFAQLGLWRPGTADNRLAPLASQSIGALSTQAVGTDFELSGAAGDQLGQLRNTSIYLTEGGGVGTTQRVDLLI